MLTERLNQLEYQVLDAEKACIELKAALKRGEFKENPRDHWATTAINVRSLGRRLEELKEELGKWVSV